MTTHQGSCHCGDVTFTFEGEITSAMDCNCSYCRRQGRLLAFGAGPDLQINAAEGAITTYKFGKEIISHEFCTRCGVSTHGHGVTPKGAMVAINVRCIPALDLEALTITKIDGASF